MVAALVPRRDRALDIVLWGATGFTGQLVAEYLARSNSPARWAIAGRSRDKLERVRDDLARATPALQDLPLLTAEAHDRASLDRLVADARVVVSTVGPYAKYGHELARAAAEGGTDYCDLTGEVPFIRDTIDANDARAKATGALLVPCCGFDSIPSDLGTFMLHEHAKKANRSLAEVRFVVGKNKGGVSGGTIASMFELVDQASRDGRIRRLAGDPYALSPDREHDLGLDGRDAMGIAREPTLGTWTGPFVMAAVNTRVVRRSNALLGHAYGKHFRYSEVASYGTGFGGLARAVGMTAGLGGVLLAASSSLARPLLRRVLPAPGEGPSKQVRDSGFFEVSLLGTLEGDARPSLLGRVVGTSDPGYGETAKMLGESALCLARDRDALPVQGGVVTPAVAMGAVLLERLRAAGMTFSVEPFTR